MTEADRALVGKVERFGGQIDRGLCRIIRELEAERDRLSGELGKANKWNADHYEETIKLRRRWQWERRRADRLRDECGQWLVDYMKQNSDFYKEREYAQTLLAERDALRARCERLRVVLRELARAATDTANEHGCSGDLGARLSEARAARKEDSDGR